MKTDANDSAHPTIETYPRYENGELLFAEVTSSGGLTKRESFAMAAVQGLLTNDRFGQLPDAEIARYAVSQADALIAELNKEQK